MIDTAIPNRFRILSVRSNPTGRAESEGVRGSSYPRKPNTDFRLSWILAGYTIAIKGQREAQRVKEDWVRVQVWKELDPLDSQVTPNTMLAVFLRLTGT
jgi:hypothetical protein